MFKKNLKLEITDEMFKLKIFNFLILQKFLYVINTFEKFLHTQKIHVKCFNKIFIFFKKYKIYFSLSRVKIIF